jgi:hypothetical protein
VVDDATFEPVATIGGPARAIVAARLPSARLLDNLLLPEPAGARTARATRLSRPDTVGEAGPSVPAATVET